MSIAEIVLVSAVGLLLTCLGAAGIRGGIGALHRRRDWRTVVGRIVDWHSPRFDSEDDACTARVKYQYELFGTSYSGSADVSWDKSDFSRPYCLGKQLPIAYNPDQPAQSVLVEDMEGSTSALVSILLGIVMLGGVPFVLWAALSGMLAGLFP